MPRITNQQYLETCHRLRQLWQENPDLFALIKPEQQWQVHDYFKPSAKLSDAELLAHRAKVSLARPSLPQQAGRALATLTERAAHWATLPGAGMQPTGKRKLARDSKIIVSAIVQPEIDLEALAQVMLDIINSDGDQQPKPGHVEDRLAS